MIVITGSEGLIGKSLANQCKQRGLSYLGFDSRIAFNASGYGNVCHPITAQVDIESLEGIVHLAAVSRVVMGQQDPQRCWLTNTMGTYHILEGCWQSKRKPWVIYASSREVYGQQQTLPVTEESPLLPMNHYACSKFAAENLVSTYKSRGLRTQILRFSSVYGRVDDYADRVIPAFCRAAVQGQPLRIEGKTNVLDFTHVDDVVDGIMRVIKALQRQQALPPAMHFTTGKPTTLYEAATLATRISGRHCSSPFVEAPTRDYDVSTFYGDPTLAHNVLGWRASISIEAGIQQFIDALHHQKPKMMRV